jgi:hypothetical protein
MTSFKKLTTTAIRNLMKSSFQHQDNGATSKITVIKRDNDIIVRLDRGGCCRYQDSNTHSFGLDVAKFTGFKVEASTFEGRKQGYSYVWHEAKIIQ